MRTAFFTLGSGSGNLMIGAAVYNGFIRAGIQTEFRVFTDCEYTEFFTSYFTSGGGTAFSVVQVLPEPEKLFRDDLNTQLFISLKAYDPDLIIVFKNWLPVMPLLEEFSCPKILLLRECPEKWLHIRIGENDHIDLNSSDYDRIFSIEPGFTPDGTRGLPPFVLKNRDELPLKEEARRALDIPNGKKCCIISQNGRLGEFQELLEVTRDFQKNELSDYQLIPATNSGYTHNSIFPLIDHLPAADFLIGGAGYNLFYESRMLNLPSLYIAFEREAENQQLRIDTNSDFQFNSNGADILVGKITSL